MGLDARRGAGFPPELYEDVLQGWKTKPNEADEPISQAAAESLEEMAARQDRPHHRAIFSTSASFPSGNGCQRLSGG